MTTAQTTPRSILIVDDEDNVRNALRRSLRSEGYQLHFASEPSEALELLKTTPVDLVISDHLMPNMTGLEFLKLVRSSYPDVVRMMLTGYADIETTIAAINQGEIYRFLTKPWDDTELKVTLFLAFDQLDLQRENRRLLAMVHSQRKLLKDLVEEFPGMATQVSDAEGAFRATWFARTF